MTRPLVETYDSSTVRAADIETIGAAARSAVVAEWRQFLRRPADRRMWSDVVWWWDSRRFLYSLIVLAATCATVVVRAVYILVDAVWEEMPDRTGIWSEVLRLVAWPLFLMLAANAWYTGGWVAELALRIVLRDRFLWLAPVMLAAGVIFSLVFIVFISMLLLP
jgi:hypothetical protein